MIRMTGGNFRYRAHRVAVCTSAPRVRRPILETASSEVSNPAQAKRNDPPSWTTIKAWSRDTLSGLLTGRGRDLHFVGTGHVPHVWKSMILVARKAAGGMKLK